MSSKPGYGRAGANHAARVLELELKATQALLESLNTPRSLTVSLLLKYGEYQQYVDLSIEPSHYLDMPSFCDDYQATEILKKNPRLPLSIDRKKVAIRKFFDAEALCAETNSRLLEFHKDPLIAGSDILNTVFRTQDIIQRILGTHPNRSDLSFIEESMRFGPGATTSISGIVTQGRKYSTTTLDCTSDLVAFRAFSFPHLWKGVVTDLNIVSGSRLTTVPKNAKTDRCICIEPDLNIFVQLGIGACIKRKLKRFGLDLNSQEGNRSLASQAQNLNLATVDLSSASDTLSIETVRLLLPQWWTSLIELPRCPTTEVEGSRVILEKWSSMGNGYTFELESLIFYSVALSVTPVCDWGKVSVFGDDIIVPSNVYPDLIRTLNFLGFKVNKEKTFGSGLFYESCGTDWFNGFNVRPFFLRSDHHDFPTICYLYANNARRWAHRRNGGGSCDSRCLPFWLRCFRAVRPKDAHLIPEGQGDTGFIVDFDKKSPSIRSPRGSGWGGYWFVYRRIASVERIVSSEGSYLAFLSGKTSDFTLGREALRGRHKRAVRKLGYSLEWPNLGPWL